jgi:hypothetical protein
MIGCIDRHTAIVKLFADRTGFEVRNRVAAHLGRTRRVGHFRPVLKRVSDVCHRCAGVAGRSRSRRRIVSTCGEGRPSHHETHNYNDRAEIHNFILPILTNPVQGTISEYVGEVDPPPPTPSKPGPRVEVCLLSAASRIAGPRNSKS